MPSRFQPRSWLIQRHFDLLRRLLVCAREPAHSGQKLELGCHIVGGCTVKVEGRYASGSACLFEPVATQSASEE